MIVQRVPPDQPDINIRLTWEEMKLLFDELETCLSGSILIPLPKLVTLRIELLKVWHG